MRRHQGKPQSIAAFTGQRETDQAPAKGGHEVDDFSSYLFGGNGEVAFVFAIFIVDDDQHAPGARFFNRLGNRRK